MDNRELVGAIALKSRGGGGVKRHCRFEDIISLKALHQAWCEFRRGKKRKIDAQRFALSLEDELVALHEALAGGSYAHDHYTAFFIQDPKLRSIHKATVRDRVLHHAVMKAIMPLFEPSFIYDSYSSRTGKGTHAAVRRLQKFIWHLSRNNTRRVWVLKCDIKKFFASVDQTILLHLLADKIADRRVVSLLSIIIHSFNVASGKGIPLGNVTSQLFSNVYLNELDQFLKRTLKFRHYIRYADDFVIVHIDRAYLEQLVSRISDFLQSRLKLNLHDRKVFIRAAHQGIDFLGYIVFPHHIVLRTNTKRRIFRKIKLEKSHLDKGVISEETFEQSLQSYLGVLKHCRSYTLSRELLDTFDLAKD